MWYLLAVQRVESCIYVQCQAMSNCKDVYMGCPNTISAGIQPSHDPSRMAWVQDPTFDSQCLKGGAHSITGNFNFGIYALAVPIVGDVHAPVNKVVLPLFWGIMTMRYLSNPFNFSPIAISNCWSLIVISWQLFRQCSVSYRSPCRSVFQHYCYHLRPALVHNAHRQHSGELETENKGALLLSFRYYFHFIDNRYRHEMFRYFCIPSQPRRWSHSYMPVMWSGGCEEGNCRIHCANVCVNMNVRSGLPLVELMRQHHTTSSWGLASWHQAPSLPWPRSPSMLLHTSNVEIQIMYSTNIILYV